MIDPGGSDRRQSGRRKVLHRGTVFYVARGTEIERHMSCVVLDISDASAKLKPETHGVLPDRFRLQLHDSEAYDCTVVRRSGYLLAVTLAPAG